jgi:hypothetical protein
VEEIGQEIVFVLPGKFILGQVRTRYVQHFNSALYSVILVQSSVSDLDSLIPDPDPAF